MNSHVGHVLPSSKSSQRRYFRTVSRSRVKKSANSTRSNCETQSSSFGSSARLVGVPGDPFLNVTNVSRNKRGRAIPQRADLKSKIVVINFERQRDTIRIKRDEETCNCQLSDSEIASSSLNRLPFADQRDRIP